MLAKAETLFQTLRYFSTKQLVYLFVRRVLPIGNLFAQQKGLQSEAMVSTGIVLPHSINNRNAKYCDGYFVFLNQHSEFCVDTDQFDWGCLSYPKLWRYNLHYFDWFKDEKLSHLEQGTIIDSWIKKNPIGKEDAWEPYPASLRIVNWVRYFGRREKDGYDISKQWLSSLAMQCRWLSRNMEYHIRANHLFKNYVALVVASLYLENCFSKFNTRKIFANFEKELVEQFTREGGHYERSPMYHCIALEDLIDVYQAVSIYLALKAPQRTIAPNFQNQLSRVKGKLERYIENGFDYLSSVTLVDGRISLMADSAFGIAAEPSDLKNYWGKVRGDKYSGSRSIKLNPGYQSLLNKSGYFRKITSKYDVLVNVGEPAPNYQPGHTHCDLFSFELAINSFKGKRLFVDTGVFQYAPGEGRTACRVTSAHNTAQLESLEQHQIWGEFRVGARAKVKELVWDVSSQILTMAHNGFARHYAGVTHRRIFEMGESSITISDEMSAPGRQLKKISDPLSTSSRLHLGPEFCVSHIDEHAKQIHIQLREKDKDLNIEEKAKVAVINYQTDCVVHTTNYYPEFGRCVEIDCIHFTEHKKLPSTIVISINIY